MTYTISYFKSISPTSEQSCFVSVDTNDAQEAARIFAAHYAAHYGVDALHIIATPQPAGNEEYAERIAADIPTELYVTPGAWSYDGHTSFIRTRQEIEQFLSDMRRDDPDGAGGWEGAHLGDCDAIPVTWATLALWRSGDAYRDAD